MGVGVIVGVLVVDGVGVGVMVEVGVVVIVGDGDAVGLGENDKKGSWFCQQSLFVRVHPTWCAVEDVKN